MNTPIEARSSTSGTLQNELHEKESTCTGTEPECSVLSWDEGYALEYAQLAIRQSQLFCKVVAPEAEQQLMQAMRMNQPIS